MLMKHFFLACVGSKMAKDKPNDRVNTAKHVPLSDDWNNNLHLSREQNLTCDPQLGGGGGGGGVLPIMAYTGRFRPKGIPFSGFRYMKG